MLKTSKINAAQLAIDSINLPSPKLTGSKDTILSEAEAIIYGDREETYGTPSVNLDNIAKQWSLYLNQLFPEMDITIQLCAEDVCWMMVQLKMMRQLNSYKRDNLVDAIGYIGLIERLSD